jgi:arsenite methyltransferase
MNERSDYGVDGYVYVVSLLGGGLVALALGAIVVSVASGALARAAAALFAGLGALAMIPGLLGVHYVKRGKFVHRDRLLDRVHWRGDEHTLDLGTGGGLILVGAAKRAPRGRAIGVDVWSTKDLSNNSYARTAANVALEGVAARAEIRTEDARQLSFPDESFDVIVSMLCIHNLDEAGRTSALREAVRVCKRGGVILISDLAGTKTYADSLHALGMKVTRSGAYLDTFPLQRIVEARRTA